VLASARDCELRGGGLCSPAPAQRSCFIKSFGEERGDHGASGSVRIARTKEDVIGPTAERVAKGGVVRLVDRIIDVEGRAGLPWQALDTLARMERQGVIKTSMRKAGNYFHDQFRRAALDPLFAADPRRIPVQLNALGC
jgi:hypothetical protein